MTSLIRSALSLVLLAESLFTPAFALPGHALPRQLGPWSNSSVFIDSTLSAIPSSSFELTDSASTSSTTRKSPTSGISPSTSDVITSDVTSIEASTVGFPGITTNVVTSASAASTTPGITSFSSSDIAVPTIPFGVTTTVISDTTYTLTYVSSTVTGETTIIQSDASTTTTETYTDGAPIWIIPTLPPGFPGPIPGPPPIAPPSGGGGGLPCVFGCGGSGGGGGGEGDPGDPQDPEDPDDPSTENPQSATSVASKISSTASSSSSSSSSSSIKVCEATCSACNDRREILPTPAPRRPRRNIPNILQFAAQSLLERNIPGEDSDGAADTFDEVRAAGNTLRVPHAVTGTTGVSSSQFTEFDEAEHNIYVEALFGCTSVMIVSQAGAWMSHLWQGPYFEFGGEMFNTGVLDYLKTEIDAHTAAWADRSTTKVFIMTPAIDGLALNGAGDARNGNHPPKFPDRLRDIQGVLNERLEGAAMVEPFVYRVQQRSESLQNGPYGKAMILYSNNQQVDPDTFDPWKDPEGPRYIYQVWTQLQMIGTDNWTRPCNQAGSKRQDSCPIESSSLSASSPAASSTSDGPSSASASSLSKVQTTADTTLVTITSSAPPVTTKPSDPVSSPQPETEITSAFPISEAPVPSSAIESPENPVPTEAATPSCFVPLGCENLAAPDSCAVACT